MMMNSWQQIRDASELSLEFCQALDQRDPLASFRDQFELPKGVVYLDGNSLGPLLSRTREHLQHVINQEWGTELIRSWNSADWFGAQSRIGSKLAQLIGAKPNEVIVADSTSINLYKLLHFGVRFQANGSENKRGQVLTDDANFPTDVYMAQSVCDELEFAEVVQVPSADLHRHLTEDVALLYLSHVDFKSGALHDMEGLTQKAHECGALVLWDLAHSAGALDVSLNKANVDFAVGCGYKYLNGGPGAPAFAYVAEKHLANLKQPLSGWFGHRKPFDFSYQFEPAPGIERLQCGTAPILSLAALEASLDLWSNVSLAEVRQKSLMLSEFFLRATREILAPFGIDSSTPEDPSQRGSHVALHHPEGYSIVQALLDRNVIGDFRPPDLMRFGLTPLYLRFVDIWLAIQEIKNACESKCWLNPKYQVRSTVT